MSAPQLAPPEPQWRSSRKTNEGFISELTLANRLAEVSSAQVQEAVASEAKLTINKNVCSLHNISVSGFLFYFKMDEKEEILH